MASFLSEKLKNNKFGLIWIFQAKSKKRTKNFGFLDMRMETRQNNINNQTKFNGSDSIPILIQFGFLSAPNSSFLCSPVISTHMRHHQPSYLAQNFLPTLSNYMGSSMMKVYRNNKERTVFEKRIHKIQIMSQELYKFDKFSLKRRLHWKNNQNLIQV